MGARFSGSFFSAYTEKEYTFTIYDLSGEFILKPVQLIDCRINYINGADETFDPILPAELTAELLIDDGDLDTFIEDLAASSESRFIVKLERDNIIEFLGYVLPDLTEQEDVPIEVGYKFTLKATDGLGRLKGIEYSNNGGIYFGSSTFIEIILKCLNKLTELQSFYGTKADFLKTLVNWHAEQYTYANTIDPLANTRVPERAFYTRDKKGNFKFRTCFDVLKSICEAWNARMIYSLASFQMVQVNEFANADNRKFFTYSRTGTATSSNEDFFVIHEQVAPETTDVMRISGGKFTFMPPLKYVLIDYRHIATENLAAGLLWNYLTGSNPQNLGPVDFQFGSGRLYVSMVFTYSSRNFLDPSVIQGLWYVFNITIGIEGSYIRRQIFFINGQPVAQPVDTLGSTAVGYQIAVFVPHENYDFYQEVSFISNVFLTGDLEFDVFLHSVYDASGTPITETIADYEYSVGNLTVEHLYEGTLDSQSDIRRFISRNITPGNSAFHEIETIIGDGIGVNSPGHLQVLNDSAEWVIADGWRVGNAGSYVPFTALKAQEIIRSQLTPIRKYQGVFFQKTDTLYRPNQVIKHIGHGNLVMMGANFRTGLDEVDGTWFYIDPQPSGWSLDEAIDYPEGEGADAGKPKFVGLEQDPPLLQIPPQVNEQTFREEFTSVTNFLTVTVNQGLIPSTTNKLFVYQNGQLISPEYYYVQGGTVFLNYTALDSDVFTVVFLASSYIEIEDSFREEFTEITGSIVVTVNDGGIPQESEKIYLYLNGQLLDPTYYNIIGSEIFLTFTPELSDKFTVVFGRILTALKAEEQIFREQFTGVDNVLTVSVNNGNIPQSGQKLYVYQNGQLISPDYYTVSGADINLTYSALSTDVFTVIFGEVLNSFAVSRMYKEEFTGITTEIEVTVNSGNLPANESKITLYKNGQIVSESGYSISGSTITLSSAALITDLFILIFWT